MKITHSNIDFKIVREVLNKLINNIFNPDEFVQYPNKEVLVAMTAHQEQLVLKILGPLYVEYKLRKNRKVSSSNLSQDEMTNMLNDAYSELSLNDKFKLMILFFSPDMKSDKSIYIEDNIFRNFLYKSFLQLLKKDKIKINSLKKQYLLEEEMAHLLPLYKYIEKDDKNHSKTSSLMSNNTQIAFQKKEKKIKKTKSVSRKKPIAKTLIKADENPSEFPWFIASVLLIVILLVFNYNH